MLYLILTIVIAVVSYLVQHSLQKKFEKYSRMPLNNGMTGAQVAQKMLQDHGIYDVTVKCVNGSLTDHYNPIDKTLNLSETVYGVNSVAAAAVAAHECGHAVQHATSYAWLTLRSKMVPITNFASRSMSILFLVGILCSAFFNSLIFIEIAVGLYAITTLFTFVTLPVEINASQRALSWLDESGITNVYNHEYAADALRSAAYTYVVSALASLATLLYYIYIFLGRRD
ncbi:MAG: zinc metallopeptidase [Paludibacteraceae bacterium]|nr:zinc metallopeptidase [Paludibacteraceae bacterium]